MQTKAKNFLTVKEFSRLTHTSIDALKHYDRIGLLKPAYIGENKYRYYLPEQALLLTRIIFAAKAKINLNQIKKIISKDDPDHSMLHYEQISSELENDILEIRSIQNSINNLKYYYNLAKNNPLEQLFTIYLPEWFIIYSLKSKISAEYESTESNIANNLFIKGFYNGFWPHYQLGAFFSQEEIIKGRFEETSYFLKVEYPEQYDKKDLQFVPGGDYICLLTKVKGQNLPVTVRNFLGELKEANMQIIGNVFILDVINNMLTANPDNYCTMIFAKQS